MNTISIFRDKYKGELIAEVSSFDALCILDKSTGFKIEPEQVIINGDCLADLPTTRARYIARRNNTKKLLNF